MYDKAFYFSLRVRDHAVVLPHETCETQKTTEPRNEKCPEGKHVKSLLSHFRIRTVPGGGNWPSRPNPLTNQARQQGSFQRKTLHELLFNFIGKLDTGIG